MRHRVFCTSGYVQRHYTVDFDSLLEARLDIRLWESSAIEIYYENDVPLDVSGDVTNLVAGLSNVKALHLSPHSIEVSLLLVEQENQTHSC